MANFMSLKNYAKKIGLKEAEAKKQLQSSVFNGYWKETNGKILVSFEALSLWEQQTESTADIDKEADYPAPPARRDESERDTETGQETVPEAAKDDLEIKEQVQTESPDTEEINRLRREIEELRQTVSEKDKQIADFAIKFAELAQQAQQIAGQAQYLQLSDKKYKELEATAATAPEESTEQEPQKKQGFFSRLLWRNSKNV